MFKKNVGGLDRAVRVIVGLAILGAGYYYHTWWGLLGLVLLFTAVTSSCYLYTLLGLSTCKVDAPKQ